MDIVMRSSAIHQELKPRDIRLPPGYITSLVVTLAACLCCKAVRAQEDPAAIPSQPPAYAPSDLAWLGGTHAATPYRPTISNPAELSAPGWLEVEAGLARTKGGGVAWQNNTPWLLKLAFTEDFGVMLGGDVGVRQTDAEGGVLSGRGDTSLAFKHHWKLDDDSAVGLEWGAKFATAADGIGSGKRDFGLNGIYSRDIGSYRIDANLGATRLGLIEEGLARHQYPWAVAVSRAVTDDWTLALELAGVVAAVRAPPRNCWPLRATAFPNGW